MHLQLGTLNARARTQSSGINVCISLSLLRAHAHNDANDKRRPQLKHQQQPPHRWQQHRQQAHTRAVERGAVDQPGHPAAFVIDPVLLAALPKSMWGRRSSSASADAQAGASDTIELQEARCTGMYQKALRAQGQGWSWR